MESLNLVLIATAGVVALVAAVVWAKVHPFVALLTAAIGVGLAAGMPPDAVIAAISGGMGSTLGFVAVVVGLGSMFGAMLEESGGAERLAGGLVALVGPARTWIALAVVGFLVCIPVFLDVALVMLLPLAAAAARRTGSGITTFAFPMLAGMAVTHAFVPPTPGPTAVAQLLDADLGWVIAMGIAAGVPTLAVAATIGVRVLAPLAPGRLAGDQAASAAAPRPAGRRPPPLGVVVALLALPLVLIVGDTAARTSLGDVPTTRWLALVGHPFTALLLATLAAFWFLGVRLGMPAAEVQRIAERSLEPAGTILLVTGAGGVFKQVLVDSGAGKAVAESLVTASLPPLVVAWLVAAIIRLLQGSATVAMITAAGLVAPLVAAAGRPEPFPALMTIAIAAGGTIASHVNDSGFWLVCRFLGLSVRDALRTWTVLETVIAVAGLVFVLLIAGVAGAAPPEEPPGLVIYREHCVRCHGEGGVGTPDVPAPLVGDRSVNQLAAYVDETMPEDDPTSVTGEAARQVAAYIHETFYSAVARDRNRPARADLQRLTVGQHQSVLADVVGSFRGPPPPVDDARGLTGEYFTTRDFNRKRGFVFERIDPGVAFDFGLEGPAPERIESDRFAIRWTGSIVPVETGWHDFVVHTDHSARLWINAEEGQPATIDAYVKSGDGTENRGRVFLLGGRPHPLRLEFSKANQGVDKKENEQESPAAIRLLWKPPFGCLETVPERVLLPAVSPPVYAATTPFPPDDRSLGYDRGTGVSAEWFSAATAAAIETADHVLDRLERLAHVGRDAPDREARLRTFAAEFAERAFRRPLSAEQRSLVVDRPFADAPDLDTALRRSLLVALGSPRFLFREPPAEADGFATAARLSFAVWDSIPDQPLAAAAARGELATAAEVRGQAERMLADRRTTAKLRAFLLAWLRVDLGPEIAKDPSRHPEFTPEVAADLRTSLELLLDDVLREGGDFRRLFTAEEVHLNGRLAPLYGVALPADAGFTAVRLDEGRRGGVLSHPYLMSVLSYPASSSPIHRGVFLARSILGNVLKPPKQAIAPLAADQAPDLTTRERVAAQTAAVACQSCHTMINPLGFALEEFDALGRHRAVEPAGGVEKPINASGSYLPRAGSAAAFRGAGELGAYCATSRDAQEAFVQALFHALVKQPVRAWGPDTLDRLRDAFEAGGFDIRRLVVDIMEVAALPPPEASR